MLVTDISKSAPLKTGDIACIRLVSGEEIIGKITDLPDNYSSITITKPIRLQMLMNQQTGEVGMKFVPFMVGVDEDQKFQFKREQLGVTPMRARKDISDDYIRATSPLDLPSKKGGLII